MPMITFLFILVLQWPVVVSGCAIHMADDTQFEKVCAAMQRFSHGFFAYLRLKRGRAPSIVRAHVATTEGPPP
mgnify:CR=1 FL=1